MRSKKSILKTLKKSIKYVFIVLLVLFIAILAVPFIFKDKIKTIVLETIDKNIDARVNFGDLSFNSIKNFPHLTVTIHNVCVVGINEFKNDTLVSAKEIDLALNVLNVIKGKSIEIKKIHLQEPEIYALILENGKANYNIVKPDTSHTQNSGNSKLTIGIDKWKIDNGRIVYDDRLQKTYIEVGGLYHSGSGDFEEDVSDLDITTRVSDLTLMYDGIKYFNKKLFEANVAMEMNFKEKKFTFKDHVFQLGNFKFGFNGFFKVLENGYQTDLAFVIQETSFKNLISLLPGIYTKDMEGIETKGEFTCTGFVKGVYDVKDNKLPAYHLELKVIDAMFKYKHLPMAFENIDFDLLVDNKDGEEAHSVVNLKTFHVEVGKKPIHGSLLLKGLKDIQVKADINLLADLSEMEKIYPIDSIVLKGMVKSEIKIDGRYYDSLKLFPKVDASFNITNGYVKSKKYPLEMDSIFVKANIYNATGNVADTKLDLNKITFLLDDEPFKMSGTLANMKDYDYNLKIDGLLDLDKLTKIYPIANTALKGTMDFDIITEGNLAKIEAKQFNLLKTAGTLEVKNMSYKSSDIAFPVHIDDALFTFNADKIILSRFAAEFGKSNITLTGHLYNYIPYFLKSDAPIKGDLTLVCDTMDLNEWFPSNVPATPADSAALKAQEQTMQVAVIPLNIDFTIDSDIKKVKFGTMDISDLAGEIRMQNGVCTLNETGFNTMDSKFLMSGDYDTRDAKHPLFDMQIDIKKLDIGKAYKAFVDPKGTAPAQGNFSTKYALKGEIAPDYTPIYSTLTGSGKIIIDSVSVKGMELFNHIKSVSKKDEFNDPDLTDIAMETEIKGGKIFISPFSFKVSKFLTEVEGFQGFDDKIVYLIKLSSPPFNKLKIPIHISGTTDKPLIKLGKGHTASDFESL